MSLCEIREKLKSFLMWMKALPITDEVSCGRCFFRFGEVGVWGGGSEWVPEGKKYLYRNRREAMKGKRGICGFYGRKKELRETQKV